jgi:RNA polymerase sigma factor (sigma-70 family)
MSSARIGDSKAFKELSIHIRNISFNYFRSKYGFGQIKSKDDVDDLTNTVYLSFAEQYNRIKNLEHWLRKVMFLNFINFDKKNKTKRMLDIEEARYIEQKDTNPGDYVDAERILASLSSDKQSIIKMRFWDGLKFNELADKKNKSPDAIKKMFYRSIEELRNKL